MTYIFRRRGLYASLALLRQWLTALNLFVRWIRACLTGWDRASSEALYWVMTLHSCSDVTPVLPDFRRWADERAVNRERFEELSELWDQIGSFKDRARWRQPSRSAPRLRDTAKRPRFHWQQATVLTVVVAILLGIGITYRSRTSIHPTNNNSPA